jgi:hypothetical protein
MTYCASLTYLTTLGRNIARVKKSNYLNHLDTLGFKRDIEILLEQWLSHFTELNHLQVPTDPLSLMRYSWILNLLAIYYFIRLSIIRYRFFVHLNSRFQSKEGQQILHSTMEYLSGFKTILVNLQTHNPRLTSMPLFFKHCILSSAAFHCLLIGMGDGAIQIQSAAAIREHIQSLENFSALIATAQYDMEMIKQWVKNPHSARLFLENT